MFPFPKVLNTYVNPPPVDELQRLIDEVQSSTYTRIINDGQASNSVSNLYTYMLGTITTGTMWGSPFNSFFTQDSSYSRVYQHAHYTDTLFQYYRNNPTTPCIARRIVISPYSNFLSQDRNGYVSNSYGAINYPGTKLDLFVYYDPSSGRAMQYNPSTNTEPTRYYTD